MTTQEPNLKPKYWRPLFGITRWDGRHREENAPNFIPGGILMDKDEAGVNKWKMGPSILATILLLIALYFIPFPINLILFIILLLAFTSISFLVYMRRHHSTEL